MESKSTTCIDYHLSTVLRKISILFRGGQVIRILFLTVQKTKVLVILTPQMPKHHQVEKKNLT